MIGKILNHYEIIELLGAGGMGEVYRAHDSTLKRDVAIKVLPADLAEDPERLARLEREAHLLASLNHPHIASIYSLEEADGVRFLVLELVEGDTLAERLAGSQREERLGMDEALGFAGQIAEALEAAHNKGIIHRDLKPANIKITPDDQIKVLDFGLAKAYVEEAPAGEMSPDLSKSPTVADATRTGMILGTAAYMSPEQARMRPLDKRTDVWSFGCVLYEMLAGERPFQGDTISDTLAAILRAEPEWDVLPQATPASVRTLLRRCLAKDLKHRIHDMGDVWLELDEAPDQEALEQASLEQAGLEQLARGPVASRKQALPWLMFGLATVAAILAFWSPWRDRADPLPSEVRLSVTLPQGDAIEGLWSGLALSPDGSRLVFSVHREGTQRLFWRRIDSFEVNEIPGTEGATAPFFSPDGDWVGFSVPTEHELKRVSLSGGSPQTLCTCDAADASWGADGTIVFAGYPRGNLFRISIAGGVPEPVTSAGANFEGDEYYHLFPQILPGGEHVLFTATDGAQRGRIAVVSLETGERHTLIERGTFGRYVPTGHIVYVLPAQGDLLAVAFDLERLEVEGEPVPLLGGVRTHRLGNGSFALSETGTLAYVPGPPSQLSRPAWVGHDGNIERLPFPPGYYQSPRVAPDGERISVSILEGDVSAWLLDPSRGTSRRLTPEGSSEFWQVWHPDGRRIVSNSFPRGAGWGRGKLHVYPVDSSDPEVLLHEGTPQPSGWSPDGRTLIFQESFADPATGFDIWTLPLDGDGTAKPLIMTPFNETHPVLSPDGRWLAYVSDESNRYEVYVRSYPEAGELIQISSAGGIEPLWSPDGRQLYYRRERDGGTVLAVPFRGETALEVGQSRVLFELTNPDGSTRFYSGTPFGRNYDLAPDGERFLVLEKEPEPPITQVNVVLNWFGELVQRVPTGR